MTESRLEVLLDVAVLGLVYLMEVCATTREAGGAAEEGGTKFGTMV